MYVSVCRKSSTVKPSVPIDSPPQTQILLNTYEEPLPVKNSPSSSDEKEEHFGANYFHPSHLNRESYGKRNTFFYFKVFTSLYHFGRCRQLSGLDHYLAQ